MKKIFMHPHILTKYELFITKLRYNNLMKTYLIWLIGVITWNFTVPDATPIEDVLVAMLLSFLSIWLKKILK